MTELGQPEAAAPTTSAAEPRRPARPRAPFPNKPPSEVVARLRRALRDVWTDVELGELARAAEQLEAEVIFAICDLESWTVEAWEQARDELEAARPVRWRLGR
jgi:hypothetical protein